MYNLNKGGLDSLFSSKVKAKDSTSGLIPVRVVDIILDDTHPEWDKYGKMEALGAIKYRVIGEYQDESDATLLDVAFPLNFNFKSYPLLNEIVLLTAAPAIDRDEANVNNSRSYYTTIVNLWNNPHNNAFPDTKQGLEELGYNYEDKANVGPLQPFQGDLTVEGRQGQTLRFTGVDHDQMFVKNDNQKAITIISNGKVGASADSTVVENINDDPASIYMVEDHKIELSQANSKRKAWNSGPEEGDAYKGSQVMINSGRLFFNAKEENILLSAVEDIGGNAARVSWDGEEYVAVDATKVYLGTAAFKEKEPVLLGATTQDWMRDLLSELQRLGKALAGVSTAGSSAPGLAQIKSHGASMAGPLGSIKKAIDDLDSIKVFTE